MPVEMKILLNDNGTVSVSGPLGNKVLCLGILAMAERAVYDFDPAKLVAPTDGDLAAVGKPFGPFRKQ